MSWATSAKAVKIEEDEQAMKEKSWYAAHVLLTTELLEGELDYCPVWENIYLIHATSAEEAWARAEKLGQQDIEVTSEGLTFDDKPARWRFVGVRSLMECLETPGDGVEVAWMQYTVQNRAGLDRLMQSKPECLILEPQGIDENGDAYHPELIADSEERKT